MKLESGDPKDAHAIAITSYQGGAVEMFTHTKEILDEEGFGHISFVEEEGLSFLGKLET